MKLFPSIMAKTGTFLKQLGTLGFSILLYPRKQHPDTIVSYTWTIKGIGLIFCTLILKYIDFNRWKFQFHCINTFYRIIWKVNECFFLVHPVYQCWSILTIILAGLRLVIPKIIQNLIFHFHASALYYLCQSWPSLDQQQQIVQVVGEQMPIPQ